MTDKRVKITLKIFNEKDDYQKLTDYLNRKNFYKGRQFMIISPLRLQSSKLDNETIIYYIHFLQRECNSIKRNLEYSDPETIRRTPQLSECLQIFNFIGNYMERQLMRQMIYRPPNKCYEKPNKCGVCYENLDNQIEPLSCGHWCHWQCMLQWILSCPFCQQKITYTK